MARDDWTGAELAGRLTGGRYLVTARLSEGGMATIYRGRGAGGVDVVIKTPLPALLTNPMFRARFQRETKALAAVAHPHVVRLLDSGEWGGVPFLVVPHYPGGTLAARQSRTPDGTAPMPPASVGGWLRPVGAAVEYLHGRNLVHRDLKPENIFYDAAGRPLVADFGIVKVAADDPEREATVYTEPGSTIGTPAYMAPELIMGRAVDGRTDVFALGVMAYEWLTGRLPFDGANPSAILVKQFSAAKTLPHPCDLVPALPRELAAAVLKAMAVNPAHRYSKATEFAAAVERAVPPPVGPPPRDRATLSVADDPADAGPEPTARPSRWWVRPTGEQATRAGLAAVHLLVAWVVLLAALDRMAASAVETPVGMTAVVFTSPPAGVGSLPAPPLDLGEGVAAVVLWPLAFGTAAALGWFRRPSARVVGLALAAAVGWAAATRLLAGFYVVRPVALGGWLTPPWLGLPYAVGVWVVSFLPLLRPALDPAPPPPAVTVLARVSVLLGGGLVVAAVTAAVRLATDLSAGGWVLVALLAVVGGLLVPAGVGLERRRGWARVAVLALAGVLAATVLGLGYFAAAAFVLLRRDPLADPRPPAR